MTHDARTNRGDGAAATCDPGSADLVGRISSVLALARIVGPPRRVGPSDWLEHLPFVRWLVEVMRPETVVESGGRDGIGFCALCEAMERAEVDGLAVAVAPGATDCMEAVVGKRYGTFARILKSEPAQAAGRFGTDRIDLLCLRARDEADVPQAEIEAWRPFLSERAVVLVAGTSRGGGAAALVETLRREHRVFDFVHGGGLAVAGLGGQLPPAVERLLAEGGEPGTRRGLRETFARLGQACAMARELQALRSGVPPRSAPPPVSSPAARTPLADVPAVPVSEELKAARALLRERAGEIAILTRELIRTQDALAAAQSDTVRLRSTIAALEADRAESDRLRSMVTALEADRAESDRLRSMITALEADRAKSGRLRSKITALEADRAKSDRLAEECLRSVEKVYRSTSWRITAPLRAVSRGLRRVRAVSRGLRRV